MKARHGTSRGALAPNAKDAAEAREIARAISRSATATVRGGNTPPPRSPTGFAPGDGVRHELFGPGRVLAVSGDGAARRVRVAFPSHGEKNLVLQYARLVRVDP